MLLILLGFLAGLVLLIKGADEMVSSAIKIAQKFNLPSSVIGATFIGFGTSAPELFASTGAALNGDLDLAIGNIIGSNIANSLLVVAVLYLSIPKDYAKKIKFDQTSPVWMAVLTTLFVSTFVLTEEFPLFLGIALLILVLYVIYKLVSADAVDEEEFINEDSGNLLIRGPLSLIATIYGSQLVVNNAIELAELFGVSSLIIGSTIIAIGTSLPEVAGTISAAKMRKPDIPRHQRDVFTSTPLQGFQLRPAHRHRFGGHCIRNIKVLQEAQHQVVEDLGGERYGCAEREGSDRSPPERVGG